MASYMMLYTVPDAHLDFLKDNPTLFDAYLCGETPDLKPGLMSRLLGKQPPELPGDWPDHEQDAYSTEISHRQVKAFHYILNGTDDIVNNVGSVFQTWFKTGKKTPAVVIDGENFAFLSQDVQQLLAMIKSLNPELRRERLDNSGRASEIHGGDEFVEQAFSEIAKACNDAMSKGTGLMWTDR